MNYTTQAKGEITKHGLERDVGGAVMQVNENRHC